MSELCVGKFKVNVSEPYPVWCKLEYGNASLVFAHQELRDLEYAVSQLIRRAAKNLPPEDRDEV